MFNLEEGSQYDNTPASLPHSPVGLWFWHILHQTYRPWLLHALVILATSWVITQRIQCSTFHPMLYLGIPAWQEWARVSILQQFHQMKSTLEHQLREKEQARVALGTQIQAKDQEKGELEQQLYMKDKHIRTLRYQVDKIWLQRNPKRKWSKFQVYHGTWQGQVK